jgi:hypothetical protein
METRALARRLQAVVVEDGAVVGLPIVAAALVRITAVTVHLQARPLPMLMAEQHLVIGQMRLQTQF